MYPQIHLAGIGWIGIPLEKRGVVYLYVNPMILVEKRAAGGRPVL